MIWLKRCPRCDGDLFENSDMYGRYIACLQCGHYLSEPEEVLVKYAKSGNRRGMTRTEVEQEIVAAA